MAMGNRMKRVGLAAVTLATALMLASPVLAASNVTVLGSTTCSTSVIVTVRNSGFLLSAATVSASAVVNGALTTRTTTVLLGPGQTTSVGLKFGGFVGAVLSVGVYDDNVPF